MTPASITLNSMPSQGLDSFEIEILEERLEFLTLCEYAQQYIWWNLHCAIP